MSARAPVSSASSSPPSSPLAGLVVGVTADRRAEEQRELLERRGARVLHAPAVRTLPLGPDHGLRAATEAVIADPPDVVLLNTGLGVRAWIEAADSMGVGDALTDAVSGATILARGPKALGAAVTAGWTVHWKAPGASSAEMVEHLATMDVAGRRVAVQLDGRAHPVLADAVEGYGAEVVAVPVYRWELPDDPEPVLRLIEAACDGVVDAVTFTSSPAVWNVTELARGADLLDALQARLSDDVLTVCVGPICAAAAREAGFGHIVEPERARLGPMVRSFASRVERTRTSFDVDSTHVLLGAAAVVVDGTVIELTRREREVLGVLAARPGAVVDKARILREVWNGESDDHAVEVTVGRLRRRLDGTLRVESVPRRGYRLVGLPR